MKLKFLKTIRGKLTLSFLVIFGVTLVFFSIALYSIYARQSRNNFDFIMTALATTISETIKETGVTPDILEEIKQLNKPGSNYSGYIEVLNSNETVAIKSSQLSNADVPLTRDLVISALNGRYEFATTYQEAPDKLWDNYGARILYFPAVHRQHRYAVILVAPLSNVETMLQDLKLIIYITIPITLLLSAFAGWFFSKQAYAPVNEIVTKANTITAEKLNSRLAVSDADDEIAHLSETLNNMMERLDESFKTLKRFTSDASHELKTPLTILRGEIEVTLKKGRTESEYEDVLRDNLEEVKRLQSIVESLLMLSQYENRKMVVKNEKLNLNELVEDSAAKGKQIADKKDIKISLNIDESASEGIYIEGDYQKLLNVFINLFDNAVKYSNHDTAVKCGIRLDEDKKSALISISDEGIGIPEDALKNIFERFYRADKSRTRDEGFSLGLGLSIVKAVIESHNGSISVTSIENTGTTFIVKLPALN